MLLTWLHAVFKNRGKVEPSEKIEKKYRYASRYLFIFRREHTELFLALQDKKIENVLLGAFHIVVSLIE